MTKDEALNLALEALQYAQYSDEFAIERGDKAITAIKQARALDKKADNARELGLDYQPVALDALVKEEMRYYHDGHYIDSSDAKYQLLSFAHRVAKLYTTPPATQPAPDLQAELEATNRQVEILSDALAESRREVAQLKAQPAVPDAFGTREGEHPQYIQGWNDCRAEMLREFKEKQA